MADHQYTGFRHDPRRGWTAHVLNVSREQAMRDEESDIYYVRNAAIFEPVEDRIPFIHRGRWEGD